MITHQLGNIRSRYRDILIVSKKQHYTYVCTFRLRKRVGLAQAYVCATTMYECRTSYIQRNTSQLNTISL